MPLARALEWANWEVLWIHNGKLVRKNFDQDLAGAQQLFLKARGAGRKAATLRCKNHGFPPPLKYQPREVIVKRHGKRVRARVVPMKKLNASGVFWCPYCMQMRRFKFSKFFRVDGIKVEEKRYVCPVCSISTSNSHVQKHNPMAYQIEFSLRSRSGKKKGRRRRRRPQSKESV